LTRNVALLAPTFYPDPSVGAVRLSQWARHLPTYGWTPLVLCKAFDPELSKVRELVARDLHDSIRVRFVSAPVAGIGPSATGKASARQTLANRLRGLIVPDISLYSWVRVRKALLGACDGVPIDVLVSSSPAHSIHDAGRWLARALRVPWVADFRDPYLLDARYRPRGVARLLLPLHERFERRIYRDSACVIHAIPAQSAYAKTRYPTARSETITNGYPVELADAWRSAPPPRGRVSVRSVGVICPQLALRIAECLARLIDVGVDAEFMVVGPVPSSSERITGLLHDRYIATGYVSYARALQYIREAHVLVAALAPARAEGFGVSSRLFEYLATSQPILALNATSSDYDLLRGRARTHCLSGTPTDAQLDQALRTCLEQVGPPLPYPRLEPEYARSAQAEKLAAILESVVRLWSQVRSPDHDRL
jgi:glycosyltransferase involved in cell wall biosynthesis